MATNEKIIEAVVARNRTVHDRVKSGSEIVDIVRTAGQKMKLPETEVKRLRGLGFLVPETVEEVRQDGVQITGGQVSINESE